MADSPSKSPIRVLVVGPAAPAAERLIELLNEGSKGVILVGADAGTPTGEFEWRGETEAVVDLASLARETFDVAVVARAVSVGRLPTVGRTLGLPGSALEGRVVLPGFAPPPASGEVVRLPDPIAGIVATTVQALGVVAQAVEVVTYEAASSQGRAGMDELRDQTIDLLNFREPRVEVFPERLAFDVCPRGAASEAEFVRDFNALMPGVGVQAARMYVPAFVGFLASVRIQVEGALDVRALGQRLEADDRFEVDAHPSLARAVGAERILVSPPRLGAGVLHLWLGADDTHVGAAVPAARLLWP